MINKILGALVGLSLLTASCRSKTADHNHTETDRTTQTTAADPVAELEKKVLATHDSAMADMSELVRLKKEVKVQLSNVAIPASSTELTHRKEEGLAVSKALTQADEAMMNWMNAYNGDTLAKLNQQQAIQYLNDQQQNVHAVRQLMLKSMGRAKAYLK